MKIILSCLLRQFWKHVESHLIVFKTYYRNFFKCYSCLSMKSFCELSAHTEMSSTVVTEKKFIPFKTFPFPAFQNHWLFGEGLITSRCLWIEPALLPPSGRIKDRTGESSGISSLFFGFVVSLHYTPGRNVVNSQTFYFSILETILKRCIPFTVYFYIFHTYVTSLYISPLHLLCINIACAEYFLIPDNAVRRRQLGFCFLTAVSGVTRTDLYF